MYSSPPSGPKRRLFFENASESSAAPCMMLMMISRREGVSTFTWAMRSLLSSLAAAVNWMSPWPLTAWSQSGTSARCHSVLASMSTTLVSPEGVNTRLCAELRSTSGEPSLITSTVFIWPLPLRITTAALRLAVLSLGEEYIFTMPRRRSISILHQSSVLCVVALQLSPLTCTG